MTSEHVARPVLHETLRLGIPATLGMLSHWLLGIADVYMVGRVGNDAIANVHVSHLYFLMMVISFGALQIGTQAVAARRWGEGNHEDAARALHSGLLIAVAIGVVLLPLYMLALRPLVFAINPPGESVEPDVITAYLRIRMAILPVTIALFALQGWFNGVGHTAIVMVTVLIINVGNIGLNWCLIEGRFGCPRLEERGAALASALSSVLGFAFIAGYALLSPRFRPLGLIRRFNMSAALAARMVRLSLPAFVHLTFAHTGFWIFLALIIPRTREGLAAVTASGIVWNCASLSFFISLGFGIAGATMLGQGMGSGEVRRATRGVWMAAFIAWAINLVIAIAYIVGGRAIASVISQGDAQIMDLAFWLFVIVASFQLLDSFGIILSEAFKGAGMTLFVLCVEVPISFVLFLIPSWWLGVHLGWGVIGAWLPLIGYAFLLAIIMIVAFQMGLWRHGKA